MSVPSSAPPAPRVPGAASVLRGALQHGRLVIATHWGDRHIVQRHMVERTLAGLDRWYEPDVDPVSELHDAESSRWSQNGEDGLLAELVRRVGARHRTFVEIGSADGTQNCTRSLAEDGWRGDWFEGDTERVARAREVVGHLDVDVHHAIVTSRNVRRLLRSSRIDDEPDVLVLDIDGSDFWVLRSILREVTPRIVVAEYNATFPPGVFWTRRNRAIYEWDETYRHGASLDAVTWAAARAGYRLVACDSSGVNAFFVRVDLADEAGLGPAPLDALYRPLVLRPPMIGHPWSPEPDCPSLRRDEIDRIVLTSASIAFRRRDSAGAWLVGVRATIANRTDRRLTSCGPTPLLLCAHQLDAGGGVRVHDSERNRLLAAVRPHGRGAAAALFRIEDPDVTCLRLCLLQEGVAWFEHGAVDLELGVA